MLELPIEASSPMISDVTSVPMTFMSTRAPPGCRLTKGPTSRTAPSTITHERPFKIWKGGEGGGGAGLGRSFYPPPVSLSGHNKLWIGVIVKFWAWQLEGSRLWLCLLRVASCLRRIPVHDFDVVEHRGRGGASEGRRT